MGLTDVSGIIPSEVARLTNMEDFRIMEENKLGGTIPTQVGLWTNW